MAFIDQKPVRSKRDRSDNHILEIVVNFMYLGCRVSCEHDNDADHKLHKFEQFVGSHLEYVRYWKGRFKV
jgi:hypothetical protein